MCIYTRANNMATFPRYSPLGHHGSSVEVLLGDTLRECARTGGCEEGGAVQVLPTDKGIPSVPFSSPLSRQACPLLNRREEDS